MPYFLICSATISSLPSRPSRFSLKLFHDRDLQEQMFQLLGLPKDIYEEQFSTLLEAFEYGAPPHGGIAFGIDRMIMLMNQRDTIRDVIAFPKTQNHGCLMMDAPASASLDQLIDLGISVDEL